MNITEILDNAGFYVSYDEVTNTWDIIDTIDEDGYRVCGIDPKYKQEALQNAYEFVLDTIFRKK